MEPAPRVGQTESPSAEASSTEVPDTEVLRRFYGWWVVGASFVVQFMTMGTTFYAFGVLLKPLCEDLGASRFAVGSALPTIMLMGAIAGPLIGREVDRRGARGPMLLGALLLSAGFLAFSRVESLPGLYASFGLLVAVGVALLGPLPNTALVAGWFERARGRALGISQIGISLSGLVSAYVTTWLVVSYGWRTAILCFAAVPIAIVLPVVYFLVADRSQDRPGQPTGRPNAGRPTTTGPAAGSLREALREPDLWRIALVLALCFSGSGAVIQVIHSHVTDLGHSETRAASVLSLMAGLAALGKPAFGMLADRTSPRSAMAVAIALQALGLLAVMVSPDYATLLGAALVFGLGFGGLMPLFGLLTAARFGAVRLGRMMGAAGPIMLPFQLFGVPFATAAFDRTGSYEVAFATFVVFFLAAGLILWQLPAGSVEGA